MYLFINVLLQLKKNGVLLDYNKLVLVCVFKRDSFYGYPGSIFVFVMLIISDKKNSCKKS